jgi:deoxyribose-phosphate aldolase
MTFTEDYFHKRFDTSIIEPDASDEVVVAFIEHCLAYSQYFAGIAFNLHQIPLGMDLLKGTDVGVAAIAAYPLPGIPTELKVGQVEYAAAQNVDQVDISMALEALRVNDFETAEKDAAAAVEAAKGRIEKISLIPHTAYLTKEQKLEAARIVRDLGATYKTNVGFGAITTLEDVRLVRDHFGELPKIMISGGCRTAEQAIAFFEAGANMIATSMPFSIFKEWEALLDCQEKEGK